VIAVDDNGPGVAPEESDAIFEMFTRGAATTSQGIGVGLSLVAQFTALHNGKVWVEDREGGGASFRVFLPRRQPL
jgi:signal transduction histidine kinase